MPRTPPEANNHNHNNNNSRPGPRPLANRQKDASASSANLSPMQTSDTKGGSASSSFASGSASKLPAAGVGSRVGPRPVPKDSSSLRHISFKSRLASIPAEERSSSPNASDRPVAAAIAARPHSSALAHEGDDFVVDDEDEDGVELGEDSSRGHVGAAGGSSNASNGSRDVYGDIDAARRARSDRARRRAARRVRARPHRSDRGILSASSSSDSYESSEDSESLDYAQALAHWKWKMRLDPEAAVYAPEAAREGVDKIGVDGPTEGTPATAAVFEQQKRRSGYPVPRRAPWHARGPEVPAGGLLTPGPQWPDQVNTPLGTPPDLHSPAAIEPRVRLEWQTMLESVLASDVLRSETKRITSADVKVHTRQEQMYMRWLDIHASLRGRGYYAGAVEAEEKRLRAGWKEVVTALIRDVREYREPSQISEAEENKDADLSQATSVDNASVATFGADSHDARASARGSASASDTQEKVYAEIKDLLIRVDSAEEQFPSRHKMVEEMPEWGASDVQGKLASLYSWYNIWNGIEDQVATLQRWTNTEDLSLEEPRDSTRYPVRESAEQAAKPDQGASKKLGFASDMVVELGPQNLLERLVKEDTLQATFEKRTLAQLNVFVVKARRSILDNSATFGRLRLPSFEPMLLRLINFPTRLVYSALRLRLVNGYKIREPSILIVDSMIDDIRAGLALGCRVKLQYGAVAEAEPQRGWNPPSCIAEGYDALMREALRFFFRLLNIKLRGSVFFKETEILEPEWVFLSNASEVIEQGDIVVARSVIRVVNKLFARVVTYIERELAAPSLTRGARIGAPTDVIGGLASGHNPRGPATAGAPTRGKVLMTLEEKVKWIHLVFDNVRVRSRKLLGFARDIRNRLDNAAEYDLNSLQSPLEGASGDEAHHSDARSAQSGNGTGHGMDLNTFMQTLINADYFLVLTGTFEASGIYVIAEPSLHDKPELIRELFNRCMRYGGSSKGPNALNVDGVTAAAANMHPLDKTHEDEEGSDIGGGDAASRADDAELSQPPRYLLLMSPRDGFMWTGRIMSLDLPPLGVDLQERRLRLIADGPKIRLTMCKAHLYGVFQAASLFQQQQANVASSSSATGVPNVKTHAQEKESGSPQQLQPSPFPLEVIHEHMAHMSAVQTELRRVNKGVYMLSDTVIRAVPALRRSLRHRNRPNAASQATQQDAAGNRAGLTGPASSDDLIQNCFGMAAEQGFRALPFIESDRLRGQIMLALARLSIDWVAFICDDCIPGDRKTFKWAVAALENAMQVTRNENIFRLSEEDFGLMRTKVASCMALLISQFDILGARSSVAKAKEEQERLDRERAERERLRHAESSVVSALRANPALKDGASAAAALDASHKAEAAKLVADTGGVGAPPMLNRHDSGMQATEERWMAKVLEWEAARQETETEQRLIGRVLDETIPEDRGLQFLAQNSSKYQIRWQQGRFIGAGTFGTVYSAVNLDSGNLMAVKEIRFQDISQNPSLYRQIKDEMSVMEMLSHPNIVEYYGIEVHRDKVFIFEEYCQGGSLAQLLEHGRIEDEAVVQVYTLQLLDGLVYLHSKGVVHRDIKPDNILLDHVGVIKFVDFGAAKVLAKNSKTMQRSRRPGAVGPGAIKQQSKGAPGGMGSLQGTPMYMSPEVIKGETRGRRGAMDVWSLGCVVLEFATGRRPWSQLDNEWAIMFHIGMAQQHPPLPDPGQLSEVGIDFIRQCLTIDPYDRPSASEMREHPWIKGLTDDLRRADEEERAAAAAAGADYQRLSVDGDDSAAGVAAMAATPGTRSVNGFNFGERQSSQTPGLASIRSGYAGSISSWAQATGAASSVTTPLDSLGGEPHFPGMKSTGTSSLHVPRGRAQDSLRSGSETPQESAGLETGTSQERFFGEDPDACIPSSQKHEEAATYADLAYDRENEERRRLARPQDDGL
ncbi:hypothetical protein IE81DRAFT_334035 [Ceraceosorus guamensis]|uniref:Protein kinase domain-containing protein n=1 Tax=Ceraceosorus guamensis TaxID=1522189 RepID=A0A316W6P1_9BASI|nr:hypothetical protein IE81DRAFT_334035 [Ceraceosorus guamensis]PWN43743.1 hypothetical protein IE81DRAFT_334035 [Ceraceosorus guamensis]